MARSPACESTRNRIAELLDRELEAGELVREAIRLIVEEALEAELADRLRREDCKGGGAGGYRNGYRRGRLKYAEGMVEYSVPRVAGMLTPWRSEVRAALAGGAEALARLATKMYAQGLSVRDIELAFADRSGRCVLSGTAACHLCKRLRQAYHAFAGRDLSRYKVRYMFVEDLAERLRREGQQCEATLAAWGVTETGSRVLLGLAPPTKNFRRFLRDLRARGLSDTVQFIPYGAAAPARSPSGVSETPATATSVV